MTNCRKPTSWRVTCLVLAVALVQACLYGPPIVEPPVEWDMPPIIRSADIYPSNEEIIVIDRSVLTSQVFRLSEVNDINPNDRIDYEFWVLTRSSLGPIRVARGTLREALEQPEGPMTAYASVSYQLNVCTAELRNLDYAVVRLRLRDEIPEEQQVELGHTEHVIDVNWEIAFEQLCPMD